MARIRMWLVKKRGEKSQQEIADLIGIDRSFYTQLENGTRNPSVNTAMKIGQTLGFDWTIFFDDQCCDKTQMQNN